MSILNDLKIRYKRETILEQLIYINIIVFIITLLFNTFSGLYKTQNNFIYEWFALTPDFHSLLLKPWSIITYGFLHANFIHILFNMLWLYYFGRLFIEYFTQKQLLNFYILGTIFGGILFILSYNYFPLFDGNLSPLVGASAGISAIVIGIATYLPNYQIRIPLVGYIKLWILATIFVLLDLLQIDGNNAGGHIAHIGGALFGYLYVSKASNKEIDLLRKIKIFLKKKRQPLKAIYKNPKTRNSNTTDYSSSKYNQDEVNRILEKISKSGYDTLTKKEKEFLFKQGRS